jgi:putative transposase
MARLARVVASGYPHHVTQRGNRRLPTFFSDEDYEAYLDLMEEWCRRFDVAIWAYCLMPNHIHLIAVPESKDGLARAIGEAHRRYTRRVNFREAWRGHLWQGRFASFPMDEPHLLLTARYIELNPVRAGIVQEPGAYAWSSAAAHLSGKDESLLADSPLLDMVPDWKRFLSAGMDEEEVRLLRRHERTGRPLGSVHFLDQLEGMLGRVLRPRKAGRKRKAREK